MLWIARCAPVTVVVPCTQDLSVCLTLLGSSLATLFIKPGDDVFESTNFRTLWVARRLERLWLEDCEFAIDMEDFNRGVRELRCMAYTAARCSVHKLPCMSGTHHT